MNQKVFCIGLSKTATTSLAKSLNLLGYKCSHYPLGAMNYDDPYPKSTKVLNYIGFKWFNTPLGVKLYRLKEPSINLESFEEFDAFSDLPIAFCYKQLDKKYPGAKFILTVRDLNPWLKSIKYHMGNPLRRYSKPEWWHDDEMGLWDDSKSTNMMNRLRFDMYNSFAFDKAKFTEKFLHHTEEIKDYFNNRENDLLIMDITKGDGWEKLCPFLNRPVPKSDVPKENITIRN